MRCPAPSPPAAPKGRLGEEGGVNLNLGRGAEGVESHRGPTPKRKTEETWRVRLTKCGEETTGIWDPPKKPGGENGRNL